MPVDFKVRKACKQNFYNREQTKEQAM